MVKREINVGVAVAIEEGLIVPVIKHADEKSLLKAVWENPSEFLRVPEGTQGLQRARAKPGSSYSS